MTDNLDLLAHTILLIVTHPVSQQPSTHFDPVVFLLNHLLISHVPLLSNWLIGLIVHPALCSLAYSFHILLLHYLASLLPGLQTALLLFYLSDTLLLYH